MSGSIDERIVEMRFNNKNFESGVKESMGSLDRLKKGLELKDAHTNLNKLQEAGRRFSLGGIAENVDLIASRFSVLGMIGVTALQNITNSAINAGKRMVSALTIDPIMVGFQEFELKMGSVQTIMAGSGESLEVVNEKLNELNKYSDRTIYSFADMTTNIGKFTNAGVSLDRSVAAIQGISNAAALSGANANEASRAMYNFAQALSAGHVKLIDWKSIELANMATVEFKNQLIQGAVAAGTLRDAGDGLYETYKGNLISATKGFNDSLQDQWMTAEVLIDVLGKYADETTEIGKRAFAAAQDIKTFSMMFDTLKEAAQSGWAETFEIIVGNFEEGKQLFTELAAAISYFIDGSADARNEMLKFWKESGGRDDLIMGIKNAFNALYDVLKPVGEAFRQIFPAMTGERLAELTKGFRNFTERLKIGEETVSNIKSTFGGFFAVLSIGVQAVTAIAQGLARLFNIVLPGAGSFLGLTAGIGEWLISLDEAIKKGNVFGKVIGTVADVIEWVANVVTTGVGAIVSVLTNFNNIDMTGAESFTKKIRLNFEPLGELFEGITAVFSKAVAVLKETAPLFYSLASIIGAGIADLQQKLIEALNNGAFSTILDVFNTGLFAAILFSITRFVNSLSEISFNFSDILDGVRESLEAYQMSLQAGALLKIAIAIGILAVSLMILATIDQAKLTASLAAIGILFAQLFGSMALYATFINPKSMLSLIAMSIAMIGISSAILILAAAMKKLSGLDWDDIEKGLISIGAMMAMLIATTKALSANTAFIIRGTASIILFAVAINILASAVKKLGEIDAASLGKGLIALWVILTALTKFMKANVMNKMAIAQSISILILATALNVLAVAVKKLGSIDLKELAKGLTSIAVILTTLAIFMKVVPDSKLIMATAIGLVILGSAMLIFAKAIENIGSMSWEDLAKGLIGMAVALGVVAVAVTLMPPNMIATGLGMVVIATALIILSKALSAMSEMTWEEIAKGLIALGGSLTILAIAMKSMTTSLAGAAALIAISFALLMLSKALLTFGSMSMGDIIKGLIAMGGAFAVIGGATLLLSPLIPAILALAGAMVLLGVAMLAAGLGLSLFAAGLTALALAGAAGTAALIALVTGLIGLIPFLIEQAGIAIILFAQVIITGIPAIMEALRVLFSGLIELLGELAPQLIKTVLEFILELLTRIVDFLPKFMDAGYKIIMGFLKSIADNIAGVVKAGIDIILNFLDGIRQKLPEVINMAFLLIITFINGLADAIRKNQKPLFNSIRNLMMATLEAMLSFLGSFPAIGVDIIKGLISGVESMAGELVKAAKGVVKEAITAAKNLLGIRSPSKVFEEIGDNIGKGLAMGIDGSASEVEVSSEEMTNKAVNAAEKAAKDTAKTAAKAAKDVFDASVSWIDERKHYNQLSLYEELDAWERVQARYLAGTEERKRADREVYRVKKELAQEEKDFANQIASVTRQAVDKKIQYEQDYYDATQRINDKLKSDIEALNDEYDNTLESRTKSLYNTYGLFDKVDPKAEVSGSGLVKNLQDQVNEFDAWTHALSNLSDRGVDSALIEELQQMGPRTVKEIQALNNLSQPELDNFVTLWQRKSSQARKVATKELEGLRIETNKQIRQLNVQSKIDLEEQRLIFKEKTKQLAEETFNTIEQMKKDWLQKIGELRTDGEKDFMAFADNIQNIMSSPDWAGVGRDIVDGMTTGIRSQASKLADAAVDAALTALQATSDALGIASPSKKFAELGKYSSMGFAEGLTKFGSLVALSASKVGTSALSAFKKVISDISDAINDHDLQPTIRPVIDMTNVESGIKNIFDKQQTLNVSTSADKVSVVATKRQNGSGFDGVNNSSNNTDNSQVVIHNNYTVRNDNDIRKISRDQKNLLDRYILAKGVPVIV